MNTNINMKFEVFNKKAHQERLLELFTQGYTTRKAKRKIERETRKNKKTFLYMP
jgi:hypothetical protein